MDKLDKIAEDIVEIKITLAKNTEALEQHIYRTALAEENIEMLRADVEPIKLHVNAVNFLGRAVYNLTKLLAALAAILGVLHAFKII